MASVVESPGGIPDTPSFTAGLDAEDVVYPCKGCGQILEEGKAFELGGHRWHIDCFRCNTCNNLLDGDANLLLLGDGSLVCNNCTYSCKVCGTKIEDLAILTGNEAYCSNCFKCRNCKRPIENLRYARTSQGIFCMACHELLMARRRKRSNKSSRAPSIHSGAQTGDKSLPALPPKDSLRRDISPLAYDGSADTPLSASQSTINEHSPPMPNYGHSATVSPGDEDFFIPIAFDSSPAPPPEPGVTRRMNRSPGDQTKPGTRDYFGELAPSSASRSASTERPAPPRQMSSPHIASQEKGRQSSMDMAEALRKRSEPRYSGGSTAGSPLVGSPLVGPPIEQPRNLASPSAYNPRDTSRGDDFRLQEAPKRRSSTSRPTSNAPSAATSPNPNVQPRKGSTDSQISDHPFRKESPPVAAPNSPDMSTFSQKQPMRRSPLSDPASNLASVRGEQLSSNTFKPPISRKEVPKPDGEAFADGSQYKHERKPSKSSYMRKDSLVAGKTISKPLETVKNADGPPPRSPQRAQTMPNEGEDEFTAPRHPPPPPPTNAERRPNESDTSLHQQEDDASPLPPWTATSELSMDDEMSRIMQDGTDGSRLLRKMSKVVKHGRSQSDKVVTGSPRWRNTGRSGSIDISSPTTALPESREENVQLRNKLRYASQKIIELESEKLALQEKLEGQENISQMNTELSNKRSTVAFLDTQRELVVRELEIMTEHLTKAKDSNEPLNIKDMQSDIQKDLANSFNQLKKQLESQIQELITKKNELTDEISNLIQMKDKGFQEYESLTNKNNQLNALNHQLVSSIQELYRQGKTPSAGNLAQMGMPPPNGLGIYTTESNNSGSLDLTSMNSWDTVPTFPQGDTDMERAAVMTAPQVVNIRKGQAKKFNWKRGGKDVAKNMKQTFKGAFGSNQMQPSMLREDQLAESVPYSNHMSGDAPVQGGTPLPRLGSEQRDKQQGWGFLSQRSGSSTLVKTTTGGSKESDGTLSAVTIFGSDLSVRCDYERRLIPAVVSRCIEEVELRGMDAEGIYRKSGSAIQVKSIQQNFEQDITNNEIADPDLDIHAVTSCLKQYFRKLPNPLIAHEVYDNLLDAANDGNGTIPDEVRIPQVRNVIDSLPRAHRETLEFLVFHLARVMERQSENLMTPLNLSVVFAPTIMRPQSIEREMTDMNMQRATVQFILDYNQEIFAGNDGASLDPREGADRNGAHSAASNRSGRM